MDNLKNKIKNELSDINRDNDKAFNLGILFITLILFVYCYFGSFSFFEKTFNAENLSYWKVIYHNLMSFVLFFVVGIIYTRMVMKKSPREFGLGLKNVKLGAIIVLIALPICAICGLMSTLDSSMALTYPMIDFSNEWYLVTIYFLSYFLYYVGWEYLFRGLLLGIGKKRLGASGAILLSTLVSALIHTSIGAFGKPMIETLSAIPAGIIFGYIAHKTDSIYPTLFIHFFIGIFTDLFIYLLV